MSILNRIIEIKRTRIEEKKREIPFEVIRRKAEEIKPNYSSFSRAIKREAQEPIKIIAEIKRASPVKGLLKDYNIIDMVDIYTKNGADAISVITEEDFFLGSDKYLMEIKERYSQIPVLRKDFIFDEYQIYETRVLGADALLLIASILTFERAKELYDIAKSLGLEVLFEIHDLEDLEKALKLEVPIVGINNRNLKTMEIDINNTFYLKKFLPDNLIVVSESGISESSQVRKLIEWGVDAILVGTSLVLSENPAEILKDLKSTLS